MGQRNALQPGPVPDIHHPDRTTRRERHRRSLCVKILGLSCDYHDAAAAVVVDGTVTAAAEEERFSRTKHDRSLSEGAIRSCLAVSEIAAAEIDVVVFHEKPLVVASRIVAARQRRGPRAVGSFAREMPVLLRNNLMIEDRIAQLFRKLGASTPPEIAFGEHHLSHAAAAHYPSPFDTAALLTIDGIGEWSTASIGHGLHHRIDLIAEQRYPHSLGLLYSLVTKWVGFEPNDGEYKLMGLAPYGEPTASDALAEIIGVRADGSIEIDARAVRWWSGDRRARRRITALLGTPRRPDEPIEQRHKDLARSAQALVETAVLNMAATAHELTGERSLALAGGVALNCVATGRLLSEGPFDEVWVQPAAGDAGSALGAALWYWHDVAGNRRAVPTSDSMKGCALGPSFGSEEIARWLQALGCGSRIVSDPATRCAEVASRLADGAIVGWFEGRMEFGPRSLGHRSILADPRGPDIQRDLNLRVKGRESFRPFAPAVLEEEAHVWFDLDRPSPHMSFVVPVRSDELAACTHVDGSARVQTVDAIRNPIFHQLLQSFAAATGCPVLLNTSFNRAGEPIVCTPADALRAAPACGLDLLVLEDHLIEAEDFAAVIP